MLRASGRCLALLLWLFGCVEATSRPESEPEADPLPAAPPKPRDAPANDPAPERDATSPDAPAVATLDAAVNHVDAPAPIEFAAVKGLALWLDAARGVTAADGAVERWADLSGHGNHAAQSGARKPQLVRDTQGRAVVRFDRKLGTYLSIADAPALRWGAGDFAMLFVAANRGAIVGGHLVSWGYLYRKASSEIDLVSVGFNWPDGCVDGRCRPDSTRVGTAIRNTHDYPAAQSQQNGLNDGKLRVIASRRRGKTLEIRVNGERGGSVTHKEITNLDFVGRPAYLGLAQPDGNRSFRFEGDIAEVLLIKGTVDDEELARLERALMTKHALP